MIYIDISIKLSVTFVVKRSKQFTSRKIPCSTEFFRKLKIPRQRICTTFTDYFSGSFFEEENIRKLIVAKSEETHER